MCGVRGLWGIGLFIRMYKISVRKGSKGGRLEGKIARGLPGVFPLVCAVSCFPFLSYSVLTRNIPDFSHRDEQDREVHIKRTNAHTYLPRS
ncbi:hypothetical protein TorRG33x02_015220 [Trema orientale]|uniref:Transmembrane protein n=1 Tax=Trema orientale TaxID=63057 RepID=A0A2P5FXL9_TREOI|nr:hypothetical protein TorRG33x02_015220 [Trema orientale]